MLINTTQATHSNLNPYNGIVCCFRCRMSNHISLFHWKQSSTKWKTNNKNIKSRETKLSWMYCTIDSYGMYFVVCSFSFVKKKNIRRALCGGQNKSHFSWVWNFANKNTTVNDSGKKLFCLWPLTNLTCHQNFSNFLFCFDVYVSLRSICYTSTYNAIIFIKLLKLKKTKPDLHNDVCVCGLITFSSHFLCG